MIRWYRVKMLIRWYRDVIRWYRVKMLIRWYRVKMNRSARTKFEKNAK